MCGAVKESDIMFGSVSHLGWTQPVLPSPQRQNMPNCVSEYAKQDKICQSFSHQKTRGKFAVKFVHVFARLTAQSTIHINTFLGYLLKRILSQQRIRH